jgi:NAD(P)-dependent dehydrogenase (short-subunit alcohol dehydrogenase family)
MAETEAAADMAPANVRSEHGDGCRYRSKRGRWTSRSGRVGSPWLSSRSAGRGKDRLESAAREIRNLGSEALPICVDVASFDTIAEAAGRIEHELGPIDIWINNAMVTVFAPVHAVSPDEYRRVTEVTYLGQVHGTLAALNCMRPRNRGTIVQVGSALSYRAIPLQSAYCAAKFAVRGFTDSLRTELTHERSRIRITMVQLPAVNTPQFDWARTKMSQKAQPVPPIFQPEAIAREIVKAAREAPRERWIGRSSLKAIVGNMLVPRVADKILATQGYRKQLTGEPSGNDDNLYNPPLGDPGAHGRFDKRANGKVTGFDPTSLRVGTLAAFAGLIGVVFALGRSAQDGTGTWPARKENANEQDGW